jgi:D-glycero-alpha-D-manno-heptose-7-phosphate kinase
VTPADIDVAPEMLRETRDVVRSRAPLRISFCGGGTDVPPFPERYGGCVLSSTIDKYAYVSVRPYADRQIRVYSEDTGIEATFDAHGGEALTGKLDLAQAIFRRFRTTAVDCFMHNDAPPGSGLGSSSAMIVALITALARSHTAQLTPYQVAELAFAVEREDLGIVGGLQDQYASAFGGFNFIEFSADGVLVTPLRITEEAVAELHYHLVLCFTGKTRLSSNIVAEQTQRVVASERSIVDNLNRSKELAVSMKRELLKGRLLDFGDLLDQAWALKRTLATHISNDTIEELYAAAKAAGAIGGKILGAGGGGYLLFFTPFNRRARVRERLEQLGGRVVDFQFDQQGARSWCVPRELWADP